MPHIIDRRKALSEIEQAQDVLRACREMTPRQKQIFYQSILNVSEGRASLKNEAYRPNSQPN
jgi:hypothetical protein